MKTVSAQEFSDWAAENGINVEEGFLSILPNRPYTRFWVFPPDPAMLPHFINTLLVGLDKWKTGLLWPRSGKWFEKGQFSAENEGVRDTVLSGVGVPKSFKGALQFDQTESDSVISILFVYLVFHWCGDDDLFFIPDHARQVLQTDHHDVVHVECLSEEQIEKFVAHMASEGYELPTELPDETFIRPAWMSEGE
jgi:hypothetical protein